MHAAIIATQMGIDVRFANSGDLDFVSQDGYIPRQVVGRKIDLAEVIVAEVDDALVGYLRLEYLWSIVPYVALISVVEPHRRRGVGKAMLAFLSEFLRKNEHSALYSSSTGNEPEPQEWHVHVGFEPAGAIEDINPGGIAEVFFRLAL